MQSTLNKLTKSDVITSSLCCLEEKRKVYNDDEILIFTFDEEILSFLFSKLKISFEGHILGLKKNNLLYQIILNNQKNYDFKKICLELNELLWNVLKNLKIKLIILECTNLSPYKKFFRNIFSGEIIDLLVLIEKKIPGTIQKEFL